MPVLPLRGENRHDRSSRAVRFSGHVRLQSKMFAAALTEGQELHATLVCMNRVGLRAVVHAAFPLIFDSRAPIAGDIALPELRWFDALARHCAALFCEGLFKLRHDNL